MKKWICRILVFVFIIVISIVISEAAIGDMNVEGDLARFAENDADGFLNYKFNLSDSLIAYGRAISYKSGICLYHTQSEAVNNETITKIKHIIDIDGSTLKVNGVEKKKNRDDDILKLAYALHQAYTTNSELTYFNGQDGSWTAEKKLVRVLFYNLFDADNDLAGYVREGRADPRQYQDYTTANGYNEDRYKELKQEAREYASTYLGDNDPEMYSTNPEIKKKDGKTYIGPFKVGYDGCSVSSIQLKVNGGDFKDVKDNVYLLKDEEYEKYTGSSIPNNKKFYIQYNGNVDRYEFNIGFETKKITAKMLLFYNPFDKAQNLGIYATKISGENVKTLEWEDKGTGSLKIIKKDADSDNGIKGAKILVTGPNGYRNEFTMTSSTKKITGLEPGTYKIKEVGAPNGYNLSYQVDIEKETQVTIGDTKTVTLYNKKYADLIITKGITGTNQTNVNVANEIMRDVIFNIYIKDDKGNVKYIGKNCSVDDSKNVSKLDLRTTQSDAKEFKTDKNGDIILYNIPIDTYYIKEVKLPNDKKPYYNKSEDKSISVYSDSNNFEFYLKRVTKNLYENYTAKTVTKGWSEDLYVKNIYNAITGSNASNSNVNELKKLLEKDEEGYYLDNGVNSVINEIFDENLTEDRINSIATNDNTKKAYIDYILNQLNISSRLRLLTSNMYFYRLKQQSAIVIDNVMKTGNLQIIKYDYDTKEALQGAQFNITNNLDPSDIRYVNKDVTTNSDGKIELKNLPIGKYTITEIKPPPGYKLNLQNVKKVVTVEETKTVTVEYENRKYGDLIVEKVDEYKIQDSTWSGDELNKLEELVFKDVKFKIYYTTKDDETPRYITNFQNNTEKPSVFGNTTNENDPSVTIFTTDENAKFELNNIPQYYIYHIKEVGLPDELAKYYNVKSDILDVELENSNDGTETRVQFGNRQERIDIEGYVWEDVIKGKSSVRDDVCDMFVNDDPDRDKPISNIPVHLYKNGVHIATRYTKDDGTYFFPAKSKFKSDTEGEDYTIDLFYYENDEVVGVPGAGLQQYHIEFEYNGLKYQNVISAWSMDEERRNATWEINSKADEKQELRDGINNNFNTILDNGSRNGTEGQTNGKTSTGIDLTYDTEKIEEDDVKYYESHLVDKTKYTSDSLNGYVDPINVATMLAKTPNASKDINSNQNNGTPLRWKPGLRTIKNINLGIYERRQPDMSIATDVENIEFKINGYSHIYNYKNRIDEVLPELPDLSDLSDVPTYEAIMSDFSIKAKNKYTGKYRNLTYKRYVYDSYIAYTDKEKQNENDNKLRIFVTYKISVINEGSRLVSKVGLRNFADDNLNFVKSYYNYKYKEDRIVKEEDGKEIVWRKDNGNNYWETDGMIDYNISPGYSMDVYLTYELGTEKILSLMTEKEMTLGSNVTEIKEYQTLDEDGKFYGGIDKDSAPGNLIYENLDTYEDDTDSAPNINIIRKVSKQISGLVFEDNPLSIDKEKLNTNNKRIGNGQYDNGENKIKNVKVELMKYPEDGEAKSVGKLYAIGDDGKYKETEASGITDEKGEYNFSGLIPGQYYIRYTYGDYDNEEGKHTVIIDASGKELNKVTTQNYKSTIVNKDLYKQLIENNIENENGKLEMQQDFENKKSEEALWYWYQNRRTDDDGKQSSAVDNKTIRNNINEKLSKINYNSKTDYETKKSEELHKMEAYTGMMDVSIEDYQGQTTQFNYDDKSDRNYQVKFGIIERPRQSLQVNKEISKLSLTLANGQVLSQGDPRNEEINYITYPEFGPAKIEIDSEIIEGSTLDLTYEIRIDNRSERDYESVDYYRYGDDSNTEVVKIKLDTIVDYLDEKLSVTYNIDESDSEFEYYKDDEFDITADNNSKWKLITGDLTLNNKIVQNIDSNVYSSIKKRSNIIVKNLGTSLAPDEYKEYNLTAKKLLANLNNTDLIFNNYVELIHVTNSVGRFYGEVVTNEGWKLATPGNFNVTKIQDGNANDECDNSYYDRFAKYTRGHEWGEDKITIPPPTPTPPPNVRDAQLVIIPPTGGNNIVVYSIIGIGCLVILLGGIVLIKKIVLD